MKSSTELLPFSAIRNKVDHIETLPSLPAILLPLLKQLEQPADFVDVPRVVDLIVLRVAWKLANSLAQLPRNLAHLFAIRS